VNIGIVALKNFQNQNQKACWVKNMVRCTCYIPTGAGAANRVFFRPEQLIIIETWV
jgi:hypothetical protein